MPDVIELIVADIDGCFTGGGRRPLNLDLCRQVAEYNRRSAEDPAVPHLVFCTGRPLPYIQAMSQAVAARLPSISEFGAVLWDPITQVHHVHPDYTEADHHKYEELLNSAEREFSDIESGVLIEAGKLCQLTLYPRHPATIDHVIERAGPFTLKWKDHYTVDKTPAVLNFLPPAVNKGTALDWLSKYTGISIDQMAGIGDSMCDLRFLQRCAVSAAPASAGSDVREQCTWTLETNAEHCILEFYGRIIAYNHGQLGGQSSNEL